MWPTLLALRAIGQPSDLASIRDVVIEQQGFETGIVEAKMPNGAPMLPYRLRWARTYLKNCGVIANPSKGLWQIVGEGQTITEEELRHRFKEWQLSLARSASNSTTSRHTDERTIIDSILAYRNVIVEGVAGVGKSFLIETLSKSGEFAKVLPPIVFHPSSSYEEFVEGLRPSGDSFAPSDGDLLRVLREVAQNPQNRYLMVIDEINRANTSRVLGSALLVLEPSKRFPAESFQALLDGAEADPVDLEGRWTRLSLQRNLEDGSQFQQRLAIPDNLFILGTMNTTDRSVGTIDLALRRRFVFQRIAPMREDQLIETLDFPLLDDDISIWDKLNQRLAEGVSIDAMLGHSYFFDAKDAMKRTSPDAVGVWRDLLLPQLAEILFTFNAIDQIPSLLDGLDMGGVSLKVVGKGIDGYPVVVDVDGPGSSPTNKEPLSA
jgi:AAA domain (dynein-related subfamily)/Mrr N-terminal domain